MARRWMRSLPGVFATPVLVAIGSDTSLRIAHHAKQRESTRAASNNLRPLDFESELEEDPYLGRLRNE